jgi:hypothetical protein
VSPRQVAPGARQTRPLPRQLAQPDLGVERWPWEKTEEETANNFAAFVHYRDAGYKRSLRQATRDHYGIDLADYDPTGKHSGKSRTIEIWSSRFRWVSRVEEYDLHQDRIAQADDVQAITEAKRRHLQLARLTMSKVTQGLQGLDVSKMTITQAAQALDIAVRLERQALGMPDQTLALTGAEGGAIEIADVSVESIERKLRAWLESRTTGGALEAGEPEGPDTVLVGDEDILPTDTPVAPNTAAEWPNPDDGLAAGGEPFPDTAGDDDDDDDDSYGWESSK